MKVVIEENSFNFTPFWKHTYLKLAASPVPNPKELLIHIINNNKK